jgi:hypothetical protein
VGSFSKTAFKDTAVFYNTRWRMQSFSSSMSAEPSILLFMQTLAFTLFCELGDTSKRSHEPE